MPSFELTNTAQAASVTQTWNATHQQIDGGKMDGFVASVNSTEPMGYWTEEVLPFAYSFARTFTLGQPLVLLGALPDLSQPPLPDGRHRLRRHRHRHVESLENPPPPNGTIFDRLHAYGVSWRNYFTDLPQTGIIPSIIEKYPTNLAPIAAVPRRLRRRHAPVGELRRPRVRRADRHRRAARVAAPAATIRSCGDARPRPGGDEESPQDMSYGEYWAYQIVQAVLNSPAWPRTLLIYTYDEHGGYYDHVPAPGGDRARLDPAGTRAGRRPGRL